MLAEIAATNILRAALAYTETAYKAAADEPDDPESYVSLDNGEAFECLFDEKQVAIVPDIAKHKKFSRCELRNYRYIELFDDEDMSENFPTKMTCHGRRIVLLRVYEEIPPDTHVTYWKQWRGVLRRTLRRQRKALHRT